MVVKHCLPRVNLGIFDTISLLEPRIIQELHILVNTCIGLGIGGGLINLFVISNIYN